MFGPLAQKPTPEEIAEVFDQREQVAGVFRDAIDADRDTFVKVDGENVYVNVETMTIFTQAMGKQVQVEALYSLLGDQSADDRIAVYAKVMTMLDVFVRVVKGESINPEGVLDD